MKTLLSGAAAAGALIAIANAEEAATFDLWLSTDDAKSVVAIVGQGDGGPFAVASGAQDSALDVLADDEASLVIADLRARTDKVVVTEAVAPSSAGDAEAADRMIEKQAEIAEDAGNEPEIQKIVLIKKMAGDEAKETRQIIKLSAEDMDAESIKSLIADAKTAMETTDADADVSVEQELVQADAADAPIIAIADKSDAKVMIVETVENNAQTRLVKISAAGADAARDFIAEADGLDDTEKAQMKAKLGL